MRHFLLVAALGLVLVPSGFAASLFIPSGKAKPCHRNCTTSTTSTTTTTTPPPPTSRLAVILVNFQDNPVQPWTIGYISNLYFGPQTPNVASFYAQASFGKVIWTGDVLGWYTIPYDQSAPCSLDTIRNDSEAAATAAGHDLSQYTNEQFLFPFNVNCHFSGTANWPGRDSWINLSPANCPQGSPTLNCQDWHTLPHELGHNLGLDHAHSLICTDMTGSHVVFSSTCTGDELGDQFDVMGCCTPSLFSNVDRLSLGWIPLSQLVTITQSGSYMIPPLEDPASLVYRVADGTGSYLYFENRAAAQQPFWPSDWLNGNLLIRRAPDIGVGPTFPFSQLLDGSPADNDTIPNAKGMPVGSSFTLPDGTTITNLSFDGTANTIQVTF